MADYVLTCSSTADLPTAFVKEHGIGVLFYQFFMDGNEYYDDQGVSISTHDFYDKVRAGSMPTTSMVNTERYVEFFTPYLEDGKDILHLEFSSGLSGSYNNALMTASQLMEKYPGRKIKVVDSLSASRGYGLFVHLVMLKKDEGATIEEAYSYAEDLKWKITHWFAVESLEHLRRGGRVSRASAFLGTMLNIKPVLAFNNEGKIIPVEKIRGRKKSLIAMVDKMEEDIDNPDGQIVYIGHGDAPEDAEYVSGLIKERFPTIKETFINYTGPVIGAHSGPGTVNIHYVGKQRVDIDFK
ncbi:MAG: DegV family protein [Christensenella hongkongensis]|uniref:DegV family protein n=1 Tax=Christensenella hongkongensis TaxID=270498 RepID=UPI002A74D684|nr:DegV family protein [Christensenella hongkongensis]MDY3004994.1 DegV family protein [Christensenella hongkongensis]